MSELLIEEKEQTVGETLTLKQELFCRLYTGNRELFGNGTLAYAEAYNFDLENANRDDAEYEYRYRDNGAPASSGYDEKDEESLDTQGEIRINPRLRSKEKIRVKIVDSTYDRMYQTCSVNASRLLRNAKINARLTILLNEGLNDEEVDAELALIIKNKNVHPAARVSAIKEYNSVRQRITEKKIIEVNVNEDKKNAIDNVLNELIDERED